MTLNLNGYSSKHGDWQVRRGMILSSIHAAQPHILALQAVARDPRRFSGHDQATQLAWQGASQASGFQNDAQSGGVRPSEGEAQAGYTFIDYESAGSNSEGVEFGSALVSRLPFARTDCLRLSAKRGLEDSTPRVLVSAQVDLPGGPLTVYNAHFSWVKEQLAANLSEVLPWIGGVFGPALLVGDFNAPAGEGLLDLLHSAGWVDAWEKLHHSEPGLTFEAGNPSIRIDYAFANAQLAPHIADIRVVCDQEGPAGEHVSDHYGLLVMLAE